MRRAVSRRSRSRSRTPPVREKAKKVVNMLDSSALSEAKEVRRKPIVERVTGGTPKVGAAERITCTIEGSGGRRSVFNRVSGGRFDGNRSFDSNRNFDGNRSFTGNRSFNAGDRCVNLSGDGFNRSFPGRRSFPDRSQREEDDAFRRRREDADKPVMKLVDPQEVPRSQRFFTHDDRGGESQEWRGRDMYDPRKDTGRYDRRMDRDRRDRDYGNRRYDDRRDDRERRGGGGGGGWDGFSRQNVNTGYSGSQWGSRSGADGVWTHDKYLELETEDEKVAVSESKEVADDVAAGNGDEDDGVLVIDSAKTDRVVE